jgi:hypothetical protein
LAKTGDRYLAVDMFLGLQASMWLAVTTRYPQKPCGRGRPALPGGVAAALKAGVKALRFAPVPPGTAPGAGLDPDTPAALRALRRADPVSPPLVTAGDEDEVTRTRPVRRSCSANRTRDGRPCLPPMAPGLSRLRLHELVPTRHPPGGLDWRHVDLGVWRLEVRARLRRLDCPTHGVWVEAVAFARARSRFTRDFEDLVGFLATTADKTTTCRLVRIDWATVGCIVTRVTDDGLALNRLNPSSRSGSTRCRGVMRHNYLTLVSNHRTNQVDWGAEGCDGNTLDGFFDKVGTQRCERIAAVSMDMSAGYAKSVAREGHAPKAVICYDPFHVVLTGPRPFRTLRSFGPWSSNKSRRAPRGRGGGRARATTKQQCSAKCTPSTMRAATPGPRGLGP